MASLVSQATALGVRLARIGTPYVDERALAHHIKYHRIGPARPSAAMRRRFDISSRMHSGREVYTVAPRGRRQDGADRASCNVMYLHGGAYVEGIFRWHWLFIARMAE